MVYSLQKHTIRYNSFIMIRKKVKFVILKITQTNQSQYILMKLQNFKRIESYKLNYSALQKTFQRIFRS